MNTGSGSDNLPLTGRVPAQLLTVFMFRNASLTNCRLSASGYSVSRRAFRINAMNRATAVPVFRLETTKVMTVVTNMAAVMRLENPFRLSSFGDQILLRNKGLRRRRKRTQRWRPMQRRVQQTLLISNLRMSPILRARKTYHRRKRWSTIL